MIQKKTKELYIFLAKFYEIIFGLGKSSEYFWREDIVKAVELEFNYTLESFYPPQQTPGALFHALNYHLRVEIVYDETIKQKAFFLALQQTYFSKEKIKDISPKAKIFNYKSLPL